MDLRTLTLTLSSETISEDTYLCWMSECEFQLSNVIFWLFIRPNGSLKSFYISFNDFYWFDREQPVLKEPVSFSDRRPPLIFWGNYLYKYFHLIFNIFLVRICRSSTPVDESNSPGSRGNYKLYASFSFPFSCFFQFHVAFVLKLILVCLWNVKIVKPRMHGRHAYSIA